VSIVAASGNRSGGFNDPYCTFYPAGYYGVLGVGSTDSNDILNTGNYIIGTSMRIRAQGEGNYSLSGDSGSRQLG
jgi:hypothetical protein